MPRTTVGVLHPGEMGSSVGAAACAAGARALWASQGRSPETCERGRKNGLEDVGRLDALLAESSAVISVCPPEAARAQAEAVAKLGFAGTYVDANAVSPATARDIGRIVAAGGARFVDGGIVGPPARQRGSTRLYLSGDGAAAIAQHFEGSPLEAIPIDGPAGAASALKVCYASYTKGSAALLTAVRALARHEDVEEALLGEWKRSIPELPGRSEAGAKATAPKAWRFVGEMEEIAASFESAGLPGGFHHAAAEVYRRLARYKEGQPPTLEEILRTLLGRE